jgi:two-component system, OmpR family, sensor histidine kinase MtrB
MLDSIAEVAPVACPLALSFATVIAAERARTRRRRELLNRSLHELRRPLQALVLQARSAPGIGEHRRGQLELALDALAGLDRQVNGGAARRRSEVVDPAALAREAVGRWRAAAALSGRRIGFYWAAPRARLECDPLALSRALDNLLANALEHGHGEIRVEGSERAGRLRIVVADGADAGRAVPPARAPQASIPPPGRARGVRRGHGLRIVADVAAEHGGRFAACAHAAGASAVLELPLAAGPEAAPR